MPITHLVDHDARLVLAEVRGDFTTDEMLDAVMAAAHAACDRGYNIVSDHREVGEPATREQVEQLALQVASLRSVFGGARWAFVASKPASYGMMRMFSMLASDLPVTVEIFRDRETAEHWACTGSAPSA
jgi:hypothetical protein